MSRPRLQDCAPEVSVIIPTVSQAGHLAACLDALHQSRTSTDPVLDIVVVLNGATSAVRDVAHAVQGVRVVDSAANRGFAGGCNLGTRSSTMPWLAFLNDDVRVTPGWLDPLLQTLQEKPSAGAVGPRILGADGTVQEIGSILWRDGTTRPFGRGLPAASLAWRWRRRVDYASACALVVRRQAWDAVEGFDEGYHPAYYEDVDFCLKLEAAGFEVWVDPSSDVVHAESASTSPSFKTFLFQRHRDRLLSRWGTTLTGRVPPPRLAVDLMPAIRAATQRINPVGTRVLVVDDRVPRHGLGSGFDRMADTVTDLATAGASVRFLATEAPPEFSPAIAAAGIEVLEGGRHSVLARELATTDVVFVSRPNNAAYVHAAMRRINQARRARYVYDAEALYHRRLERHAELRSGVRARMLRVEASSWRRAEAQVAREADAIVCVSREESAFFVSQGATEVHVRTPWLRRARLTDGSLRGRADIGFVAGWLGGAASPNGDALEWFATDVLPLVTAVLPWVRLRVTGTLPPPLWRFQGLSVHSEGFVEDLPRFYSRLRVAVAPLRYGSGVKLKTVEALQHGVPIVSTSVGAEGLSSLSSDAIAIHDSPDAFAAAVLARLCDVTIWRRQRRAIESALEGITPANDWNALIAGPAREVVRVDHTV